MSIDRRNFLKALGVAGATFTVGQCFGASAIGKKDDNEFYGILYDATRCVGCQSCEMACAEKYGFPPPEDVPEPGVVRETTETQRIAINQFTTPKGDFFMRTSCNHCDEPACASACLTKAMYKTKNGPVIWREDKCIGCRSCMIACPFDIPKFEFDKPNPKINKCIMCYGLMQEGKQPACVAACPAEALTFGKKKDLLEEAKTRIYASPDDYYHHVYGETEVGGTGVLRLSPVPFEELGMRTDLGDVSYPEYNKTFLYSVPAVLVLWPAFLLGLHNSTEERKKRNQIISEDES